MMNFILQWNVGGLISHLSEFKQQMLTSSPIAAALQETHFRDSDNYNFNVPGYTMYQHNVNSENRQGGVALYVCNSIPQRHIPLNSTINAVATNVKLCHCDIAIVSMYLPPNLAAPSLNTLDNLFSQLPEKCLILGDMNAHNPIWGSRRLSPRGSVIETWVHKNSLIYMNDGAPTFMSRSYHTTSSIDLSLASPRIAPLFQWTVTNDLLFSDHFPIHLILTRTTPVLPSLTSKKWITSEADWTAYNNLLSVHAPYDLDTEMSEFVGAVHTAAAGTIKHVNVRTRTSRTGNAVWWNWKCQRAKAIRRRAFRSFQRCICNHHAELYTKARKECQEIIRREKQAAWEEFASSCNRTTPLTKVWKNVRSFSSRQDRVDSFPQLLSGDVIIDDPLAVTNAFAQHFAHESSTPIYPPDVHQALLDSTGCLDFSSQNAESYNAPFTMRELKLSLNKSNEQTSVGPDGLPYAFFTNLNELNLSTLLIAINNLWSNHTFPEEWFRSLIIPILKPGKDRLSANSYRPISLTCCVCKLVERMVNTRLMYFLESNQLLDPFQSGFRGNHSTADNISRLISDVQAGWELRHPTVAVFLDLTSAFNKVHRSTMIYKLHEIGIRGNMAHFLCQFIQPRYFRVRCQSTESNVYRLEHGVPQGSVISPTLFLIAINDIFLSLPRSLLSIRYSLFADDLAIWSSHRNCVNSFSALQRAIDHCVGWCHKWGFFLSAPKSTMLIFKRGCLPPLDNRPKIKGIVVPLSRNHKFLGITLDSGLTFQAHVETIRTRCLKRLNVLRCLSGYSWGSDRKTLTTLYIGLIRSTLEYNCFLFSTVSVSLCKKLEVIQSTCLRLITGAFRTSPVLALRADTYIPALADRRNFLLIRFFLKTLTVPNHPARAALEANRPNTRRPLRRSPFLTDAVKQAQRALHLPRIRVAQNPPLSPFWLYNDLSVEFLLSSRKSDSSPAEVQMAFQEYKNLHNDSVFFYTDGSAHGKQVGAAATGPGFELKTRLPDYSTVFSAEVYAVREVLLHIKSRRVPQATICTDSKSSLEALLKIDDISHPGVYQLHKLALSLADNQQVTFLWIPGHCGIAGNVLADALANESALLPLPVDEPLPLGDALHLTKIRFAEHLQNQWDCTHSTHMYNIKPSLGVWPTCLQPTREREVILARLRCGHTRLTHSHLFDRTDPPICETCKVRLSVEHILIGCNALAHKRRQILNYIAAHRLELSLSTLLGNDDPHLITLVLDFVLTTPAAGKL